MFDDGFGSRRAFPGQFDFETARWEIWKDSGLAN